MFMLVLLISATLLEISEPSRILVILPFPGKSHHNFLRPITDHLATKGHELTIYTSSPTRRNITNVKEIELKYPCMDRLLGSFDFNTIRKRSNVPVFGVPGFLFSGMILGECSLNNSKITDLMKSNEKYDLVILETHFGQETLLPFGHKFQAPVVSLNTLTTIFSIDEYLGNPFGTAYIPNLDLQYTDKMTFFQRAHNALRMFIYFTCNYAFYIPKQERTMRKFFNYPGSENIPPLTDLLQNISLVVTNTQPIVDYPKPWVPNVIAAGGAHISTTRQPLPQDLQEFMDNSKYGVIYVSFGSVVRSEQMPDEMKSSFLRAFGKLKQNVLWKLESDTLPNLPKNVKISKWLPQQDILAHPNCLVFMTHGGFLSHLESVYFGVPHISMPFFGDQYVNTLRAVNRGFAVLLDQYNITENSLTWAFHEILSKKSYRENVKKYSDALRDTPLSPLESAAYWIEYVIRHKGASHLRSEGRNLPYYKYLLLDVIAFILLVFILFTFIIYKTIKYVCKRFCKKCNSKKLTSTRKKN